MSKDEWFRNTKWNKEIEEIFELKLKRARGSQSKAEYLRIQASYLLESLNCLYNQKGVELMKRLIDEYPDETFHTIFGKEQLGDYHLSLKEYEEAEGYYREVTNHYYDSTRSGTTGIADIKLSRTILESQQNDKFEEAINIATTKFRESNGSLTMNDTKYYYAETLALLYKETNRMEEAKVYAQQAISLETNKELQFSRHKTIGIIDVSNERISKLNKIANE